MYHIHIHQLLFRLNHNSLKISKIAFLLAFLVGIVSYSISNDDKTINTSNKNSAVPEFFGDSTLTIVSSNRPNGYLVKIFQTNDLTLLNLSRGDSINQYVAIHEIPKSVSKESFSNLTDGDEPKSTGVYVREINIPIETHLCHGLFFMDVNFDGEEELVIEYRGYNRFYYACYDVVNGVANVTPGILHPMNEPPYNNIVSESSDIYGSIVTEFDYDKKTIHIFEQMGAGSHVETWCEMVRDNEYDKPKIQIVRQEDVYFTVDTIFKTTYVRIDGELKKVSTIHEKW